MSVSDIIMLSTAALLTACLFWRLWRKLNQPPRESRSTGHGINVAGIADRVQRVRSDVAVGLQSGPHESFCRSALLATARRTVAHLDYFRKRAAQAPNQREDEIQGHIA